MFQFLSIFWHNWWFEYYIVGFFWVLSSPLLVVNIWNLPLAYMSSKWELLSIEDVFSQSYKYLSFASSYYFAMFFLKNNGIKNEDSSLDSDGETEIRIFLYFASISSVHRQPHLKMRISPADRQNCMITRHLQKKILKVFRLKAAILGLKFVNLVTTSPGRPPVDPR